MLPTLVKPPPPTVPGLIVTYSLILLLSPITSFVFSFLYFRSIKQLKKLEKEIQALEQKAAAEKIKTARSSISQTA